MIAKECVDAPEYTLGKGWSRSLPDFPAVLFFLCFFSVVVLVISPDFWTGWSFDFMANIWKPVLLLFAITTAVLTGKYVVLLRQHIGFRKAMAVLEKMPVGVAVVNSKGTIVMTNGHVTECLGINSRDILGLALSNNLDADSRLQFNTWLKAPALQYSMMITPANVYQGLHFTISPQRYRYHRQYVHFAIVQYSPRPFEPVQDKSEISEGYQSVIKSTNNIIWNYNFETGESHYNDTIFTLLGYTPQEVKGNPEWWFGNIHPDDRDRVFLKMEKFICSDSLQWQDEYRFRCANGDYKVVEDHGYLKREPSGNPQRLLGFMTDITEQKRLRNQLLEEQVQHKMELAKAISNAQESERKIISEELHDNVCQVLGGVKLFVEHCIENEDFDKDLLVQSSNYLNDAMVELRNMAHCLSPYLVEKFGLVHGIQELVSFFTNYRRAVVHLDVCDFSEQQLSTPKKILLYRIAQEQINNIIKHAKASCIQIRLSNKDNLGQFIIEDNGIGMELNEDNYGFGLKNIQNRVELLQGHLQFISSPDNGFCLYIQFDID